MFIVIYDSLQTLHHTAISPRVSYKATLQQMYNFTFIEAQQMLINIIDSYLNLKTQNKAKCLYKAM